MDGTMMQAADITVEDAEVPPESLVETGPQRTCIVTRTLHDKAAMIRFVADPEGRIVPDLTLREARLIPDAEKLRRADFSYVNDGTLAELDAFVAGVIATLSG